MGRIRAKEASSIIKSLEGGVVPQKGIQHLLVGRNNEIKEVISILESIKQGESDIRFWVGDFGSGKSFMLRSIEFIAIQKNFVVSTIDLTPSRRFYATDGKARDLYTEIINRIKVRNCQEGNALETIIQQWIDKLLSELSEKNKISRNELIKEENWKIVKNEILKIMSSAHSSGLSFELSQAIAKYYEGYSKQDIELQIKALRWIRGDITTKTESKKELGINNVITDSNWYIVLKNLAELFLDIGYSGLVINFDEAVNLYKIPMSQTREKNYEQILNIFNECKSNDAKGLFINFGATNKTIYDEHRGMVSYGALKGRLGKELDFDNKIINTNKTVLELKPLSPEEIYTLLDKLKNIYNTYYDLKIDCTLEDIESYMNEQLNRPGSEEFLTPRKVIKDFLEILDINRQNNNKTIMEIINMKFGDGTMVVTKDIDDNDDIEVL